MTRLDSTLLAPHQATIACMHVKLYRVIERTTMYNSHWVLSVLGYDYHEVTLATLNRDSTAQKDRIGRLETPCQTVRLLFWAKYSFLNQRRSKGCSCQR